MAWLQLLTDEVEWAVRRSESWKLVEDFRINACSRWRWKSAVEADGIGRADSFLPSQRLRAVQLPRPVNPRDARIRVKEAVGAWCQHEPRDYQTRSAYEIINGGSQQINGFRKVWKSLWSWDHKSACLAIESNKWRRRLNDMIEFKLVNNLPLKTFIRVLL